MRFLVAIALLSGCGDNARPVLPTCEEAGCSQQYLPCRSLGGTCECAQNPGEPPIECVRAVEPQIPVHEYDLNPTVYGATLGEVCDTIDAECKVIAGSQTYERGCGRALDACNTTDPTLLSVAPTTDLWLSSWQSCRADLIAGYPWHCLTMLDVVPPL